MPPRDEAAWAVPRLFVYGLLRPGERYWPQLAPAVRRHRPARVRGALHLHASGAYPMLVLDGEEALKQRSGRAREEALKQRSGRARDWVVGALLELDDAPAVHALVFMELTAGYDARWVEAHVDDEEATVGAIAFPWPWGEEHRGARIPGGDWQAR